VYRSRYYFAWAMGHSSLALAGLDFKGWDTPAVAGGSSSSADAAADAVDGSSSKAVKGVWGRCKNAQPFKVEFCDSSRLLAGYWNTTTGNFLRRWGCRMCFAVLCCDRGLGVGWGVFRWVSRGRGLTQDRWRTPCQVTLHARTADLLPRPAASLHFHPPLNPPTCTTHPPTPRPLPRMCVSG
jgi:hypothetical protein